MKNNNFTYYVVTLFIVFSCLQPLLMNAQNEARFWYFGGGCALDFGDGNTTPVSLNNSEMFTGFTCGTIADSWGNLLFYTNGEEIWNSDHKLMKNGTGLFGYVYSSQGALFVPLPGDTNIYYLFTVNPAINSPRKGLYYHIIDKRGDNGKGELISKNNLLFTHAAKLSAVKNADRSSVWIVSHGGATDSFYSYLLSKKGININPVISESGISYFTTHNFGCMKISPDSKKLVVVNNVSGFEIFDFDNKTGIVSNPLQFLEKRFRDNLFYGIEFSPSGKYIYLSQHFNHNKDSIFQFNISSYEKNAIKKSEVFIGKYTNGSNGSALQLGIDGKIYVARGNSCEIGVIMSPNKKGLKCGFIERYIFMKSKYPSFCGLPGDGLPDFIQSYFFIPDFKAENTCYSDTTLFSLSDTLHLDSVLWNFGDSITFGANYSTLTEPTHVYSDTGLFNVSVYVWHDGVEKDTLEREIRISAYPHAGFLINDSIQCQKQNLFEFSDTSSIISGSFTWEWNFGDTTKSFDQHPSHHYDFADTFNVSLSLLSDYGCEDKLVKKVYVHPSPISSFAINDSVQCFNEQLFVLSDSSVVSGDSISNYSWYIDSNSLSNQQIVTLPHLNPATWNLKLVTTTAHGCTDTTTQQISVHPSPIADFSINDSLQCFNENSFQFTNHSNLTGFQNLLGLTYRWDLGDQTFSNDTHTVKTYLLADTFWVELVAESAEGCKDSVAKQIIVLESPKAAMTVNDSSQCLSGNEFSFSNIPVQADIVAYTWNFGDTTQSQDSNPVKSYLYADTFFVSLILSDSFGCKDTAYKEVFVRPMPKAAFTINDTSQCLAGNNFNFSNSSNISSGSLNYKWFLNDSLLGLSQHYNNLTIQPPIAIGNSNYNIKLLAESEYHCLDSVEQNIIVNPMPDADFSYSTPCLEKEITFTDKSQLATGSINEWKWHFTTQDSSSLQNPVFTFTNFGDHAIQLIVQSDSGCLDTLSKTITIYDHAPAVVVERVTVVNDEFNLLEWKAPSSPIVSGYRIQKSSDFGNFMDLKTYSKDSLSLSDFSVSPDYSIYTYHILTEDSCGHTSVASNIAQSILLELDSSESFNILSWSAYEEWQSGVARYEVQIFNAQSQSWEKLEAYPFPVAYSDSANRLSQAEYCYRIAAFRTLDDLPSHSNVVCSDTRMNLFVPNAFSPNGDGKNDVFQVRGTYLAAFELKIFNRWGELLFESNSLQNSWDGTFRNKKCPVGVYYFQLKAKGLDGKKVEKAGNVSVLR
jgi:gliding motility-associated-like protein